MDNFLHSNMDTKKYTNNAKMKMILLLHILIRVTMYKTHTENLNDRVSWLVYQI